MMYGMPLFMNMQNTTETKSRPATPTDAASRCTVLWWYNDCMFLNESTTKYSSMTYHDYQDCIQACLDCAALCNHCASSCLKEKDSKMMALCIQLDMECAAACYHSAQLMSLGSSLSNRFCEICAEICSDCAAECEKHAKMGMEHCKECAHACRICAKECLAIAA